MIGIGLRGLGWGVRERVCNRLWRAGASEASPQSRRGDGGAGRRPGGGAADTGCARVFRRRLNGLRPYACGLQKTLGDVFAIFYRFGVGLRPAGTTR